MQPDRSLRPTAEARPDPPAPDTQPVRAGRRNPQGSLPRDLSHGLSGGRRSRSTADGRGWARGRGWGWGWRWEPADRGVAGPAVSSQHRGDTTTPHRHRRPLPQPPQRHRPVRPLDPLSHRLPSALSCWTSDARSRAEQLEESRLPLRRGLLVHLCRLTGAGAWSPGVSCGLFGPPTGRHKCLWACDAGPDAAASCSVGRPL